MKQSDIPRYICDKHQMILELVEAARSDGQVMEDALKDRKKTIKELEDRIAELEQEVSNLQEAKTLLNKNLKS